MPGKRRGCFVLLTTVQSKGDIGWWMGGGFTRFLFPGPFFWGGEWGGGEYFRCMRKIYIYIYISLYRESHERLCVFMALWSGNEAWVNKASKNPKKKSKLPFDMMSLTFPFSSSRGISFQPSHYTFPWPTAQPTTPFFSHPKIQVPRLHPSPFVFLFLFLLIISS